MKKQTIRLDKSTGETWKSKALDMVERFEKSYAWHQRKDKVIYDALTGGAKFLFRSPGEYESDYGSMWYQMRDGSVLQVNHSGEDIHLFHNLEDALGLYRTLGAHHNVAACRLLESVAA